MNNGWSGITATNRNARTVRGERRLPGAGENCSEISVNRIRPAHKSSVPALEQDSGVTRRHKTFMWDYSIGFLCRQASSIV